MSVAIESKAVNSSRQSSSSNDSNDSIAANTTPEYARAAVQAFLYSLSHQTSTEEQRMRPLAIDNYEIAHHSKQGTDVDKALDRTASNNTSNSHVSDLYFKNPSSDEVSPNSSSIDGGGNHPLSTSSCNTTPASKFSNNCHESSPSSPCIAQLTGTMQGTLTGSIFGSTLRGKVIGTMTGTLSNIQISRSIPTSCMSGTVTGKMRGTFMNSIDETMSKDTANNDSLRQENLAIDFNTTIVSNIEWDTNMSLTISDMEPLPGGEDSQRGLLEELVPENPIDERPEDVHDNGDGSYEDHASLLSLWNENKNIVVCNKPSRRVNRNHIRPNHLSNTDKVKRIISSWHQQDICRVAIPSKVPFFNFSCYLSRELEENASKRFTGTV